MLKEKVENILEKADYSCAAYSGCFDIMAKKTDMLLIKVLENVDSIQEEQTTNLKLLSRTLPASPAIVGVRTRRENLYDGIIYDRFDIPTFTPQTLEHIIMRNAWPLVYRFRGGFFSAISPKKLRERREKLGLSQSQLARKVKVTKKNIYEHENRLMLARQETVKRLERIIGSLAEPIRFWDADFAGIENEPRGAFEKNVSIDLNSIGFETSFVYQSPFNIIARTGGRSRFLILSDAEENPRKAEKNEKYLSSFSRMSDRPVLVITKSKIETGLPAVEQKEIRAMTKREVIRIVKGW